MSSLALSRLTNLQRHLRPSEKPQYRLSQEVSDALSRGGAVLALESTIISHGILIYVSSECLRKILYVLIKGLRLFKYLTLNIIT
ncbi:hypothetical protein GIB67_016593 [Kingdonia uniflora]|uniref:Uncharacterized protein n=1 Tax=Kingdonia uniflora TaxID=39325 RepID=A0A7J7MZ80_9MAGN|nr:hypothetical protein GIB67_016593 [Kingdonia uniflora]